MSDLAGWAGAVQGDISTAIDLARVLGPTTPLPGNGGTAGRWELLATVAAADLTAARVAEAHLDALAILAEADLDPARDLTAIGAGTDSTWGVFAAEGPGVRVQADPTSKDGVWQLVGVKPWCSLANRLSHALITAHTGPGRRRLFAVALQDPSTVIASDDRWVSRGLPHVVSGPIELRGAPAVPVGADDWYLRRDGFAWGGAGVAACWYGGAVGLARSLHAALAGREPDQIGLMHLGSVDVALSSARAVLAASAAQIDGGRADSSAGVVLAGRVRAVVAAAAEEVLARVAHSLGPAPLVRDEVHAARVADLQIYLRQHHAERDEAALGRGLLAGEPPW